MNTKEKFLDSLRKKIKNEIGVTECLWKLSKTYIKIIACYENIKLINQKKILDFLIEEIETEIFKELLNLNFKKKIIVKNLNHKNEIQYIWESKRDKQFPYGKVKILQSYGSIGYGRDDAGSVWRSVGFNKWELVEWAEDEN